MHRRSFLRTSGLAVGLGGTAGCSTDRSPAPPTFYVAPAGDDDWSGEREAPAPSGDDGPFRTLRRARRAVRERNRSGRRTPVRVLVREGTYRVEEPLRFGPVDSGTADAPVVYEAYPGESPTVSGGRALEGWEEATVRGVPLWRTTVDAVRRGDWYFRQLFVNGERRPRPRLPDATSEVFEGGDRVTPDAERFFHFADATGDRTFTPEPGSIDPSWRRLDDVEVVAIDRWYDERMPVAAYDPATGQVTVGQRPYPSKPWQDRFYYVENVFEALSDPGEWYLDRETGECYYVPRADETLGEATLVAPRVRRPVQLVGRAGDPVEHCRLEGLTVAHSAWEYPSHRSAKTSQSAATSRAAISLAYARDCAFADGTVSAVGEFGLAVGEGCRDVAVRGCEFADLGAGGVKVGGDEDGRGRTERVRVADNHVHDGGRVFHRAAGVLATETSDTTIAHNHVHDLFYTGVSVGWHWEFGDTAVGDNLVAANHVHHLGQGLLSDMGGVYTLGVQPGTEVRGNRVHHVQARSYGGWGIYLDGASSEIRCVDNVVYETSAEPFRLHFGRRNRVQNNVFVGGDGTGAIQGGPTTGPGDEAAGDPVALDVRRNVLVVDGGIAIEALPGRIRSDRNCFWDAGGEYPLETWQRNAGEDRHSIAADPRFVDPESHDYTLRSDSPALDAPVEFEPLDDVDVGPRTDPAE